MNIIIEEIVSEFPVLITEEVFQITISDAVSYFNLIEVGDTDFVGKDGFVPVVDEATGKLVLTEQQSDPGGGVPEAPNNSNAYVRSALSWVIGYTKTAIDALLGGKFNNPTGNNNQYLDGAGVPTTFPTIPSPQNLEQVTAEGAETTTPILVKNEDNSRAIEYRSNGFAILADAGNKSILFEAETPTGITGTGKAVLKDVGDDVKTIAYEEEIILALTTLNGNINDVFNYAQTHIENANNPHQTDLNQILAQGFEAINKALKLKYNFGAQDVLELKPDAFSMFDAAGIVMLQMYKNALLAKNHASGSTILLFESTTTYVKFTIPNETGTAATREWVLSNPPTISIDADDVTETATRVFVTPSEKTAVTHSNRSILDAITESFTTALKNAYDSAVTWVTTNGTNVLNHLTNTSNPHNVTKSQVGLGNVDNTSDSNKPISTATQTALNLKANIPKSLRATSNIVLTSTTASQKLFGNLGDNGDGSFNVEVGRYRIEISITLTNLANSGSIGFLTGIGDGTSTFSNILIGVTAFKGGLTGSAGGIFTRMSSFSSNPLLTGASTNTNGFAQGLGEFSVTTAGKFFLGISLNVANTAELNTNSYCTITKIS